MRGASAVLMLAACGRIGFPATSGEDDGGGGLDALDEIAGLVAYYPLDEDPATGVITCSDPLANGTCTQPDCPTATAGHLNGAALFASDLVRIGATTLLGNAPYTVSLWVRFDQGGSHTVLSKPTAPDRNSDVFALGVTNSDNRFAFETTPNGTDLIRIIGPARTLGRWHHVAASWDDSDMRLYVDGALADATTATLMTSDEPLYLGADIDDGNRVYPHEGAIDEVRIYSRALTDGEIAVLATQ